MGIGEPRQGQADAPERVLRSAVAAALPAPQRLLTCDNFLTTAEFLPLHRDQLERTEQLIAGAEQNGNARLVEMNEPVRLNLLRIIDGLQTLESDGEQHVA